MSPVILTRTLGFFFDGHILRRKSEAIWSPLPGKRLNCPWIFRDLRMQDWSPILKPRKTQRGPGYKPSPLAPSRNYDVNPRHGAATVTTIDYRDPTANLATDISPPPSTTWRFLLVGDLLRAPATKNSTSSSTTQFDAVFSLQR